MVLDPLCKFMSLCDMILTAVQEDPSCIMLSEFVTLMENLELQYFVFIYCSPSHTSCPVYEHTHGNLQTYTQVQTHFLGEQTDRVVKNSWQCFDETPLPSGRCGGGWGGVCEKRYLITLLLFLRIPLNLSLSNTKTQTHTQRLLGFTKKATSQSNTIEPWFDEANCWITAKSSKLA